MLLHVLHSPSDTQIPVPALHGQSQLPSLSPADQGRSGSGHPRTADQCRVPVPPRLHLLALPEGGGKLPGPLLQVCDRLRHHDPA